MRKLNQLEVRQRCAEQQPNRAIAVATKCYVAPPELTQWRADEVARACAPAGLIERLSLLDRVAGLLAPQLVKVFDIQMQQVLGQVASRAIELGELVHPLRFVVARPPTPQQA